jgi:hypothetical protein
MAQVREIHLEMGQLADQQAFAEVQFSVEFSESELKRNMQYALYVGLFFADERAANTEFENNGAYQTYLMPSMPPMGSFGTQDGLSNGYPGQPQFGQGFQGNPNASTGLVSWICRETLQPAGTRTHHVDRRTTFDFTRMPSRGSNYRAMVWVVPEITEGQSYSQPQRLGAGMVRNYVPQPIM